jgi:hypothetical protein
MKIYLTSEPFRKLQTVFTNLKSFKIIDIDYIIETCGLDPLLDTDAYIINEEIKLAFKEGVSGKKFNGIIYLNSNLSPNILDSIKFVMVDIIAQSKNKDLDCEYVMMDDYDVPKRRDMYKHVDEVMFFPMYKKTKIVECKAIPIKQDK